MTIETFTQHTDAPGPLLGIVTLAYEQRQKTRLRACLDGTDTEIGLILPRGSTVKPGDRFSSADGSIVQIAAATEHVSVVYCDDSARLAKAAYHLGNRHVWVQIEAGRLCYLTDPVLDQMLTSMGYVVVAEYRPFEPESGAYSRGHRHQTPDHHHHSQ